MNIQKTIEKLKSEGFAVSYFETGADAAKYITTQLVGKSIGIGGSKTIEALNLFETLSQNNEVYWHWKQPAKEAVEKSARAQVYLTSANAISETGEIINIDGTGNRVSALMCGHEKVYIIAGTNKIADDYESAMWRARNIAAPLNAKRLGIKTPCAVSEEMKCFNCNSPARICRGISVLMQKLNGNAEMEVILINENLGY